DADVGSGDRVDAVDTEVLCCGAVHGLLLWCVSGVDVVGHDEQLAHEAYHALVVHHNLTRGVNNRELIKVPRKW
ncbi:hypothetical protein KC867_00880, partial [Candidatus Saccharibacteria bacterium]|nr:hypothetical protein [Candidatus Saccharibacteria bacterium]